MAAAIIFFEIAAGDDDPSSSAHEQKEKKDINLGKGEKTETGRLALAPLFLYISRSLSVSTLFFYLFLSCSCGLKSKCTFGGAGDRSATTAEIYFSKYSMMHRIQWPFARALCLLLILLFLGGDKFGRSQFGKIWGNCQNKNSGLLINVDFFWVFSFLEMKFLRGFAEFFFF